MQQISMFSIASDGGRFQKQKSSDWRWSFADYPEEKNGLKVFSCFACGGGSTMGYKLAGCEVLWCVEIDPKINELYVKNHHPKYNFVMDLRDFNKIPNDELPDELFHLDILDGSPPCTTFSVAGEREKYWGKKKKFREGQAEQTLDDLSFVFIETVAKLKPRYVIMENVEGLLLGEAWAYVQRIYSDLSSKGYKTKHWLLKGENMGIPQTRHRVFFLSVREDQNVDLDRIDMTFNYEPVTYAEIKYGSGESMNENTVVFQWLLKAEPCDKRLSDTVVRCGEKEKLFSHMICWPNNVMQTVAASGEIFRGEEKTRVSINDIIAAQTFPQDYVFPVNTYDMVKYVCGMSVPPVMMKRFVQRLLEVKAIRSAESDR